MKTSGGLGIASVWGIALFAPCALAQTRTATFSTLYSFQSESSLDGAQPYAGLVAGADATLYGVTAFGGTAGAGTVFELKPQPAGGAWQERVIYGFLGGGRDGANPYGTLVFGSNGDLYGTTAAGGTANAGTVFKLRPSAHPNEGVWKESILHDFGAIGDGTNPMAGLIFGASGQLYGTTYYGGALDCFGAGCGTVFELSPPGAAGEGWKETTLYAFVGGNDSGAYPAAGVVAGPGGVLYGATVSAGLYNQGTVFELKPPGSASGQWTQTILHSFRGVSADGGQPHGGLTVDGNGTIYGTTYSGSGGTYDGTAFQMQPPGWGESLYFFKGANGANPYGGLVIGANGALFGTTYSGGTSGMGTVIELIPPTTPGGAWTETVLHSFTGADGDGAEPYAGLVLGANGVLYGTTVGGGSKGWGTVFALTP